MASVTGQGDGTQVLAHTGLLRSSVAYASLKARQVSGPPWRFPGSSPPWSSVGSSSLHLSVGVYVLVLICEVGQVEAEWGLGPPGALCGGHGSVCTTAGQGASPATAGAMGGLPEVWLVAFPTPRLSVGFPGQHLHTQGWPGSSTANPEGLWVWPHHGRGLSHGVQIKPGSQTYLACTAVWSGESQDLSVGFGFSFAKGASRPLPTQPTPHSQSEQRREPLPAKGLGGAVSDLESVLTHYLQK